MARARIPVENILGPVLLMSGTDDGFWPSTLYSGQVADVLGQRKDGAPVGTCAAKAPDTQSGYRSCPQR